MSLAPGGIEVGALPLSTQLFINNEFVDAKSGTKCELGRKSPLLPAPSILLRSSPPLTTPRARPPGRFDTVNPATEEVITSVQAAGKEDIDDAVVAGTAAFAQFRKSNGCDRRDMLLRLASLVEKHRVQLAELESLDNGKPQHVADGVDIGFVIECFRYYAGWADKWTRASCCCRLRPGRTGRGASRRATIRAMTPASRRPSGASATGAVRTTARNALSQSSAGDPHCSRGLPVHPGSGS